MFFLSAPRIYNFSDFFVCTTPHPSTIQRTGVFSKWLFSTNKFLYVNTTQNVYEHVKKINFVACGLLGGSFMVRYHIVLQSTGRFRFAGNGPLDSFAGITPIPAVSEKKYYCAVCFTLREIAKTSSVSLEFKFMDFKF